MCYQLDILRLSYRTHSESLPDILYENIGRNRVSTYFTRDQNRLLVPRYVSRYMKDSHIGEHRNGTLDLEVRVRTASARGCD